MNQLEKQNLKYEQEMKEAFSVYLIVSYARPCYREYKWTGKMTTCHGYVEPEVYDFTDHNGTLDEWIKRPISNTTTGFIHSWTFSLDAAKRLVKSLNKEEEVNE